MLFNFAHLFFPGRLYTKSCMTLAPLVIVVNVVSNYILIKEQNSNAFIKLKQVENLIFGFEI